MKRRTKKLLGLSLILALPLTWVGCQATRAGYESPDYEILAENSTDYEIRRYPEMQVVATPSSDDTGRDGSFMRLFRYIDKGNEAEQKIAMTTPVFMADGDMQFLVPTEVTQQGTPKPNDEAVTRKTLSGGIFAVMRFSKRELAGEAAANLSSQLSKAEIETSGEPIFAYYDPPWTPSALRRNEVMIRIESDPSPSR